MDIAYVQIAIVELGHRLKDIQRPNNLNGNYLAKQILYIYSSKKMNMKNLLLFALALTLQIFSASAQGSFAPTNLGGPAMKYEGLKDTDPDINDPAMKARIEKARKAWVLGKDTVLAQAKNLFDKKYYSYGIPSNGQVFVYPERGRTLMFHLRSHF